MIGSYMEQHEMEQLEELLKHALPDSLACWKATRIRGVSASMVCDGNVSISLIKAFDRVVKEKSNTNKDIHKKLEDIK